MNIFNRILTIFFGICSCFSFCFCHSNNEPEPVHQTCKRTILIYMVANNSLGVGNYDTNDINEMVQASMDYGFNNGRLIVYHAPYNQNPTLLEIKDGKIEILKQYDQTQLSVSATRMQEVISDTKMHAPADDYGLILWSHANGWLQNGITPNPTKTIQNETHIERPLAFGEDQGKYMNITTLNDVVIDKNFSFIYFDCCYMGTIEVAYQLRHATPYIIASAPEIPANDMPYDYNLPLLFADIPMLKDACINTFDYYNIQKGINRSCAISLINTQHIEELAQATVAIYKLQPPLPIGFNPQKYTLDANCYYFDFGQYVEALSTNYPELLTDWTNAINKVIIYKASTPYMWNKLKIEHHSGLSTFIIDDITKATTKGYDQLQWWTDVANKLFIK